VLIAATVLFTFFSAGSLDPDLRLLILLSTPIFVHF